MKRNLWVFILMIAVSLPPLASADDSLTGLGSTDLTILAQGPPAHAPAHGYRAKKYKYYPSIQAYYDPVDLVYFWLSGGSWISGPKLPGDLNQGLVNPVLLDLATDKPYTYHKSVYGKYPPGQLKKAYGGKVKKSSSGKKYKSKKKKKKKKK